MHEFALAQDIIDTISRHIKEDISLLKAIHIEAGQFSGVVTDSLEFGLQMILQEKQLKDVRIEITSVQAVALCECGTRYSLCDIGETCPQCHSFTRSIDSGKDVIIKSIEIEDNNV